AKERQVRYVDPMALHRAEDVVILHAVLLAGAEVVFTVSRRRMNDASTSTRFNIFSQIHRREALVERMAEADELQRLTLAASDDLALQFVPSQTGFDKFLG